MIAQNRSRQVGICLRIHRFLILPTGGPGRTAGPRIGGAAHGGCLSFAPAKTVRLKIGAKANDARGVALGLPSGGGPVRKICFGTVGSRGMLTLVNIDAGRWC